MAQAAKEIEIIPQQSTALTPMAMLDRALANNAGMDMIEKLMALQERWDANQARKAFDEAMASAKAEIPPIARNREGHNSKRYADFSAIAKVVDPVFSKFGLSYRFRTQQDDKSIRVTCILSHKAGHSEENTLAGPIDLTGNKNPIQGIGSTLTYLQRYSLVQAVGLAVDDDDDGRAAATGPVITEDQATQLRDMIESVGADQPKFLKYFKIGAVSSLPAGRFDDAMKMLGQKAKS